MKPKFTPGTWEFRWGDSGDWESEPYCEVVSESHGKIADIDDRVGETETKFNGRVIAAAKDLYMALEGVLDEFDEYDEAMSSIGRGHEDYGRQRRDAKAILAKIRGES